MVKNYTKEAQFSNLITKRSKMRVHLEFDVQVCFFLIFLHFFFFFNLVE